MKYLHKKALLFMVMLMILQSTTPRISVLAAQKASVEAKEQTDTTQSTSESKYNKSLADKAYEKMQENADNEMNKIYALQPIDSNGEDAIDLADKYTYFLHSLYYRLIYVLDKYKTLLLVIFVAIGSFLFLTFRKDKEKMKWGLRFYIIAPILYLLVVYGPAINDFFTK